MNIDQIKPYGDIELIIEHLDGKVEKKQFRNTVLTTGRAALASSLANDIGDSYDFYISRMIFGDGGTNDGVPRFVEAGRNGLFGTTRVNKPVIATIDVNSSSKVIFTSVIKFDEGNTYTLNEMALQMANGDIYSMVAFPDLTKTSSIQITWNWTISFV